MRLPHGLKGSCTLLVASPKDPKAREGPAPFRPCLLGTFDHGRIRTHAEPADQFLQLPPGSFSNDSDCPIRPILYCPHNAESVRSEACAMTEEDSLNNPVNDDFESLNMRHAVSLHSSSMRHRFYASRCNPALRAHSTAAAYSC